MSDKKFEVPYGVCKTNEKGFLYRIDEKPKFDFLINTGLYIFKKDILKYIPKNKYFDMTDLISLILKNKMKVGVYPISNSNWIDVGRWSELNKISNSV